MAGKSSQLRPFAQSAHQLQLSEHDGDEAH